MVTANQVLPFMPPKRRTSAVPQLISNTPFLLHHFRPILPAHKIAAKRRGGKIGNYCFLKCVDKFRI